MCKIGYITTDKDGRTYSWSGEPVYDDAAGFWDGGNKANLISEILIPKEYLFRNTGVSISSDGVNDRGRYAIWHIETGKRAVQIPDENKNRDAKQNVDNCVLEHLAKSLDDLSNYLKACINEK